MKKISQLEWIRKAQEVHGYTYDYSKVNYLNSRRKVTIICCEHGEFEQLANSHLQGKGCQKCWYKKNGIARNSNTEEFINKAIKVHGDKYDYSKVVYSKAMEKVLITCKIHGDFSQLPSHHLNNHGCPICGDTVRSNTDDFIKRAKEVHGSRYDYSFVNYVKNSSKIKIICSKHGVFEQSPSNHTNGKQGCPKCAKNKKPSTEEFIDKALIVHGDKYDYSKSIYHSSSKKIIITCKIHGDFKQTPNSHLQGVGCSRCATRGYNKTRFIKLSKYSVLYIIKCFSDSEVFYKIGITTKSIRERFLNPKIPYEFEIVASVKSDSGRIYDLEKKLHKMFGIASYKPMKDFRGKSECFLLDENHMKEISEVIFSEVY